MNRSKFKRVWISVVSILLSIAMVLPVLADTDMDTGSGTAGNTDSSYNLPTNNDENYSIVAYRFTLIDKDTGWQYGHSVDIYVTANTLNTAYNGTKTVKNSDDTYSTLDVKASSNYYSNSKIKYVYELRSSDTISTKSFSKYTPNSYRLKDSVLKDANSITALLSVDPSNMASWCNEKKHKICTK